MASERRRPDPEPSARGRIAALIAVVVLVGAVFVVGQAIVRHNAMQRCVDSGRRDCDTRLDTP